jgi:nicotinamide riboside kinase
LPGKYTRLFRGDRESDVVYAVKHPDFQGYFVVLTEHQSTVDHKMPLRILEYLVCIWWAWLRNRQPLLDWKKTPFSLPPIVPIVFYNGKRKWTVPTQFRKNVENYEKFSRWIPDFEYQIVNLREIPFEQLVSLEDALGLCLMLDKCESLDDLVRLQEARQRFREKLITALEHTNVRDVLVKSFEMFARKAGFPEDTGVQWLEAYFEEKEPTMFHGAENIKKERQDLARLLNAEAEWVKKEAELASEKDALAKKAEEAEKALQVKLQRALVLLFVNKFHVSKERVEFFLKECDAPKLSCIMDSEDSIGTLDDLKEFIEKI